ncbi:hypothetical protein CC79DRAFT_1325924 [Sarocladium strictum]
MALPDQPAHHEARQSAKRDFSKISECDGDLSPAHKKHARDQTLPNLTTQALETVCAPIQSSNDTERRLADNSYDYPGLEEDMSSIFDHSSSLHCSGGKQWDTDMSLDMDLISWKDQSPTSVKAFPAGTSNLVKRVVPRSNHPDKTKSASQQLPQVKRQPSGANAVMNQNDFIDEDIDWDEALMSPSPSVRGSPTTDASPRQDLDVVPLSSGVSATSVQQRQPLLLRPYKTFFNISDMLSHKTELYKNQPGAVFELFARVIYTNRDRGARRQFFQLRDIIAQTPPYLSGSLLK